MNAATIHHHRPMLSVLNLLVAGAAVTLGVVAIVTDDVGSITPPSRPVATSPAVEAPPVAASPGTDTGSITDRAGDCRVVIADLAARC